MAPSRDLAISCDDFDCDALLSEWRWLVPDDAKPLMIGIFGDWIFGAPDASHWHLDLLEGTFLKCAENSEEFNAKKGEEAYRALWFGADWACIALEEGLLPKNDECFGWTIHPAIGGEFSLSNIEVFRLSVYQKVCGSLHRQIKDGAERPVPFSRFWSRS